MANDWENYDKAKLLEGIDRRLESMSYQGAEEYEEYELYSKIKNDMRYNDYEDMGG